MTGKNEKNLEISQIIEKELVAILFQQIVSFDCKGILGYEALCRGPSDSSLHSPLVLFEAAHANGQLLDLEIMVLDKIIRQFCKLNLKGYLFLNVSSCTFLCLKDNLDRIDLMLKGMGLSPSRVVIELTETHPIFDSSLLEKAIQPIRKRGYSIALDDLGEGFSSLKRWSVMKPDYVKIDRHFIEGLHRDPVKQQFIKSILDIADVSMGKVIAEGVEQSADLASLINMGIRYAQGYLFSRPDSIPQSHISSDAYCLLNGPGLIPREYSRSSRPNGAVPLIQQAGDLACRNPIISSRATMKHVIEIFQSDSTILALPVLDERGCPLGILRSKDLLQMASKPFFHEVYSRKSCMELVDMEPLIFDEMVDLRIMSETISSLDDRLLMDGFIVTRKGTYLGTGRTTELIKAISDSRIFTARYANPLTFLPGNVPIDQYVADLIERNQDFIIVYWDLNQFKPYNDIYGYTAGDEVIRCTGQIIKSHSVENRDFLGHIGGDDFVSIFFSPDWEKRIQLILAQFEKDIRLQIKDDHLRDKGYVSKNRKGEFVRHDLISLAAGVLKVKGGEYDCPSRVSEAVSEVKKQAKRIGGNAYFVDRRGSSSVSR